MSNKRHYYTAEFKAKVALEALQENLTTAQICSKYKVNATQVNRWRKELKDNVSQLFSRKKDSDLVEKEREINTLYKQVGKLTVQNEFLREKLYP